MMATSLLLMATGGYAKSDRAMQAALRDMTCLWIPTMSPTAPVLTIAYHRLNIIHHHVAAFNMTDGRGTSSPDIADPEEYAR
jgi:hypothetical protein